MYQDLHFYVDFAAWEEHLDDLGGYLPKLYKMIGLAYQHKATVFYSVSQIQELTGFCNDLDEGFSQSHGNRLDILLENAIPINDGRYVFEVCFARDNTSLHPICNPAIAIITGHPNNALISITQNQHPPLLSITSANNFAAVSFDVINDANGLLAWLQDEARSTRNFNLSPKHGENGHRHWPGESALLCSATEAQQLLNAAIPDFTELENRLFNFDATHQTYIEFFYEGDNPLKQWHGFHVEAGYWDNRVPKSIRSHFKI